MQDGEDMYLTQKGLQLLHRHLLTKSYTKHYEMRTRVHRIKSDSYELAGRASTSNDPSQIIEKVI